MSGPEKIVSLVGSATEILCALGLAERIVAVSHDCDLPEVAAKPRITASRIDALAASGAIDQQVRTLVADGQPLFELDVEMLVALAPQLILAQSQCDVCALGYDDV